MAVHPVRLRGHHLLCLLTYVGKGYTPAFVENLNHIAEAVRRGAPVMLVQGPDDVCIPVMTGVESHCHRPSIADRDRRAARDIGAVLGRTLTPGTTILLSSHLDDLRRAFASGLSRSACAGCQWHGLCSDIARGGFPGVRITRG